MNTINKNIFNNLVIGNKFYEVKGKSKEKLILVGFYIIENEKFCIFYNLDKKEYSYPIQIDEKLEETLKSFTKYNNTNNINNINTSIFEYRKILTNLKKQRYINSKTNMSKVFFFDTLNDILQNKNYQTIELQQQKEQQKQIRNNISVTSNKNSKTNINININPVINIYIYNVALGFKSVENNLNNNLSNNIQKNEIKRKDFKLLAQQKFNDIYIAENLKGIIYPKHYTYRNLIKERNFNKNVITFNGRIYNYDIITSNPQYGGTNESIKNFYNHIYKGRLTKVLKFNNPENFYVHKRKDTLINNIRESITIMNTYIRNQYIKQRSTYMYENYSNNIRDKTESTGAYIFNIDIETNEKIILFGDFHGSFHTFFRIFVRLHLLGVIDLPNFIINNGYKIIFLGDIVDRGQYSLEILSILFNFIIKNNDEDNLKIILNRGNHEEESLGYNLWNTQGFTKEITDKFNENSDFLINLLKKFYSKTPSAIILNYYNNDNIKRYWLSHGGFPTDSYDSNYTFIVPDPNIKVQFYCINEYTSNNTSNKTNIPVSIPIKIRWSDFTNEKDGDSSGDSHQGRPLIGINELVKFLSVNNISFVFRGHQDFYDNVFLLYENQYNDDFILPLNKEEIYNKNPNNRTSLNTNSTINYPSTNIIFPGNEFIENNKLIPNIKQTFLPVAKIYTDNWINKNISNVQIEYVRNNNVYPVITISSNSDNGRPLWDDNIVVLNFGNNNDFDSNIDNVIFRKNNLLKSFYTENL
jgi:hypothetical protein